MSAGASQELVRSLLAPRLAELQRVLRGGGTGMVVDYLGGSDPADDDVVRIDLDAFTEVRDQLPNLSNGAPLVPPFDMKEDSFTKTLRYVAYLAECSDTSDHVLFLRRATKSKVPKHGWAAIFHEGHLDLLPEQPFTLDESVDAVVAGSSLFALNLTAVETMFRLHVAIRQRATVAAGAIAQQIILPQHFLAWACAGQRAPKKLVRIHQSGVVARLTAPHLTSAIHQFGLIGIHVTLIGGQVELAFGPDACQNVLKLLDQDYLNSAITDDRFEAVAKKAVP